MPLVNQISTVITRIGTEFKTVYGRMGVLTALSTTDKSTLVAAINEVYAKAGSAGTVTSAGITDASTVGRNVLTAADAPSARTALGASTIGSTAFTAADGAAIRGAIGAGTSSLTIGTSSSQAKAGNYQPTAANISDATTIGRSVLTGATAAAIRTTLDVLSPAEVDTRIQSVVGAAPAALDTLDELANALGDDPNFAATVTTALANRVRVDAAQTLTGTQQTQARNNIGAVAAADVGNTETDFVAVFTAALA